MYLWSGRKLVVGDTPAHGRADCAELLSRLVHELEKEKQQRVQLNVNAEVVALWVALEQKDRSPEKSIDMTDVMVLVVLCPVQRRLKQPTRT